MDPEALAELRNRKLGFVFQFHHLLREFTALENVRLPLEIGGVDPRVAEERARELLHAVGLGDRLEHVPGTLSGGEQQRVAVARALAPSPLVVLADEPSGNLDPVNAERLHELLGSLGSRFGTALVVATHNRSLAARADRILRLHEGLLVQEEGWGETAWR
jgi:lipoprotein-releasing system ATP-binding protein